MERNLRVWDSKDEEYRIIRLIESGNGFFGLCQNCKNKALVNNDGIEGTSQFYKDIKKKIRPKFLKLNRYWCYKRFKFVVLPLGCSDKE